MELGLADVLDGLVGRAGSGHGTRVHLWVREVPGERNVHALNSTESTGLKELLARARPAERYHRRLVVDLLYRGQAERGQRPGSGGHLQVTPDRDPDASAGAKDPVDLGHRSGC